MSLDWAGKRVVVTGAAGFIGSHLAERLVELGATTRAFVRYNSAGTWGWLGRSPLKDELAVEAGDVADYDSVRRAVANADTVFHLAALIAIPYSYHAPESYVRTNVTGTLNVLRAAREAGVRLVVHTSTSEVYGTALYVPMDEAHPLQAQSPYSATKIGADKLAEAFHLSFDLPVVTVRPFNTYGPRQSARAVVPTIVSQCLSGDTVRLGDTSPTRDFNYVADTVDGFVCAAESPDAAGSVVNLGTGKETSIGDLVRKVSDLVGHPAGIIAEPQRVRPEGSEVQRLCASNERARAMLGWEPRHTLDEGLRLTIEWVRQNLEQYRVEAYAI